MRFAGKSVLITGAARGVGRAVAEAFLAEGARVALADADEHTVLATAGEIGDATTAFGVRCDVRSAGDVAAVVARTADEFQGIDCVVNAAGVISLTPCEKLEEADWDRVMDVNAKGVFLMMRAAIPALRARGGGTIINIASQAGKRGEAGAGHYCASKAAVILLSRSVALEVAPRIRVNCVCPGYVDTDMQNAAADLVAQAEGLTRQDILDEMLSEIPLKRFQQADDIARLVLFLASDEASEITGEDVNISGGLTMY